MEGPLIVRTFAISSRRSFKTFVSSTPLAKNIGIAKHVTHSSK